MPGGASSDAADPVAARIRDIAEARSAEPGPLLEILHDVQHEFGHLPSPTVPVVADVLNLSSAEVHGVMSFYADFRTAPPADVTVAICRGEACQAVGAEALVAARDRDRSAVGVGEQTPDGSGRAAADLLLRQLCARPHGIGRRAAARPRWTPPRSTRWSTRSAPPGADPVTVTVYVPRDSSARAVGADEVAVALTAEAARRGDDIRIVRNGSRGMLWLEPFVEVDVDGTRVGYGPVQASDVSELLDAGLLRGADHRAAATVRSTSSSGWPARTA